jgi:hypothetical protein
MGCQSREAKILAFAFLKILMYSLSVGIIWSPSLMGKAPPGRKSFWMSVIIKASLRPKFMSKVFFNKVTYNLVRLSHRLWEARLMINYCRLKLKSFPFPPV